MGINTIRTGVLHTPLSDILTNTIKGVCNTPVQKEYQQVFNPEKFVPNLSGFDLLFNCGPESKLFLCKE